MKSRFVVAGLTLVLGGCGAFGDPNAPDRTPAAEKWFQRAQSSYKAGDIEDAEQAAESALGAAPHDREVRVLAGKIALARLDYRRAIHVTKGLEGSEALGISGRAKWYAGDLDGAADDLEQLVRDPEVRDPWARDIARLARRGQGRHPFEVEGGLLAAVEMPPAGAAHVVPCELNGERILALVATAAGDLIVDSNTRREPAWVSLRFGENFEVKDVPALTQDLSQASRVLGAPIKALIGVNVLRHLHATFDRRGSQFVVRRSEPPAPPHAGRIDLSYVRGGGMLMRARVSPAANGQATFLVDSTQPYLMALEPSGWERSGVSESALKPEPSQPDVMVGVLPAVQVGGFDLPGIPALKGVDPVAKQAKIDVDVDGVMGAGLLAAFRVTFVDDGRSVWLEPDPSLEMSNASERDQPKDLDDDPSGASPQPPNGEPKPGDSSPAPKLGPKPPGGSASPLKLTPPGQPGQGGRP